MRRGDVWLAAMLAISAGLIAAILLRIGGYI